MISLKVVGKVNANSGRHGWQETVKKLVKNVEIFDFIILEGKNKQHLIGLNKPNCYFGPDTYLL